MDRLERTSKKSPAPQGVSRRRRQREKRYLPSHLLGNGDSGRIRAAAKGRGPENHPCSQKKAGGSILPDPSPQYLLLIRHDGAKRAPTVGECLLALRDSNIRYDACPRSALHRTGFLSDDRAVEGVDQGLDFGEFDAGPLSLVAIERSR